MNNKLIPKTQTEENELLTLKKEQLDRYVSTCGEYSATYEREKLEADWASKETRASSVVEDFTRRATDPQGKKLLDVGFGNGAYAIGFAQAGATVSGIEVNSVLKEIALESIKTKGLQADFQLYNGTQFPFPDASFDCLFSVSVLEHTSNPAAILSEADRVLKPGGCFYLAFPNRYALKETHSGYWLISYLPRSLARAILKCFGRNTVDELNLHFLSYFDLKRYIKRTSLTVRFEYAKGGYMQRLVKRVLAVFGVHHSVLLPHIMVILDSPIRK